MAKRSPTYYVYKYAEKYNLDPRAVLAVATQEGSLNWGGVGDNGTSFGPWQLHIGGAMPKEYSTPEAAAAFANSEAGVEYAMRKMAEAGASGLSGQKAIDVIVRKFERPREDLRDGEIERAFAWYQGKEGRQEPRLDGDDKLPGQGGGSEPRTAGGGMDILRASMLARVIENNAAVASGDAIKPVTATEYLTMIREAKARGTSGMSDGAPMHDQANPGKHGTSGNLINPLSTKMGGNSEFNVADPEGAHSDNGRFHGAKDWFAPAGSNVVSPEAGTIVEVKPSRGNSGQVFGGTVKVQNKNGRVYVFRHVDPTQVKVGQKVNGGDLIAKVSKWTGGSEHAHIEVWKTLEGGYNVSNMIDPATLWSD